MLQLKNATPFKATIMLFPDPQGVETLYTVVKGTFAIGDGLRVADEQRPIALADAFHGDPATSSIRVPSDVCLGKPGTDVLLLGSAWAPAGRAVTSMDVSLSAGSVSKVVRVFGDRVWEASPVGTLASPPAAFERMLLVWERAFGGADITDKGPAAEPRNPVGVGFRASGGAGSAAGMPVANLQDPAAPITSLRDAPAPACFAPVAAHWQPRVSYAGTYDETWQKKRAPYLPTDFDSRFFQLAPPGLIAPGYLQPGEWVQAYGATPSGQLQFQLPPVRIETTYMLDNAPQRVLANLDTLIIEPDDGRAVLVWRSALRCDKKALRVNEVRTAALDVA